MIRILMIFLVILTTCNGCVIGTKREVTIVYSSFSKPLTHKGAIRVMTNKKIPVSVDGKATELDCGGFYLIHKSDLQKLLDVAKGVK